MTQQEKMSNNLDKLELIVQQMQSDREQHKEQLRMQEKIIDKSIAETKEHIVMYDKRIEAVEKRWASLRSAIITVIGFFVLSVFTGAISLSKKIEMKDVEKLDYATQTEVIRGDQYVIEGIMDIIASQTDMTDFDHYTITTSMSKGVYKSVTGEVNRSIQ